MNAMRSAKPSRRQSGVALAVALILLVVLTLLALSGVRMSTMELRMALSDELRVGSFEGAQSLVDSSIRLFANTPVLAPDVEICARAITETSTATDCTGANVRVTLPWTEKTSTGTFQSDADAGLINVVIRRIPPQNAEPPVGTGFSINVFDAAFLQVEGRYDKNSLGLGAAQVNEGVAVVYAASGEMTFASDLGEFSGSDPSPPPPPPPDGEPPSE